MGTLVYSFAMLDFLYDVLAVTSSTSKISMKFWSTLQWNFEVLLLNSGYVPDPCCWEEYRCIQEIENKQYKNAIAVDYKVKVVVHIPMAVLKHVSTFLGLPGSYLEEEVSGKRLNRGGGYGLEVPYKYCLAGQEKAIDWIKRRMTYILYEHTVVVNKCLVKKWINKKNYLLMSTLWRSISGKMFTRDRKRCPL